MTTCPCCSHQMLRHIRHHQVYWFCRTCWQEMPEIEEPGLCFISSALQRQLVPLGLRRSPMPV